MSNLAWSLTITKWRCHFRANEVIVDVRVSCIWLIIVRFNYMSVKSSFYNEYDVKNNEKHVLWAQHTLQNHHQTFHDRCLEKIGPLPKKSDHWFTRTCPGNMGLASICLLLWAWTTVASNHLQGPHRESPKAMRKLSDTLIDGHLGQRRYQSRKNDHI